MTIFPIWVNDGTIPKPDKKPFFEVALNGTFLHKQNKFWEAVVPVESIQTTRRIGNLKEGKPFFKSFLPPIPSEITSSMARFFAWVFCQMYSEAMFLLWWDEEKNICSVTVPPQRVGFNGIEYRVPSNSRHKLLGTIHSHGSMPAGHSTVDHKDERFFDGIHGTFGGFSWRSNSFQISLQANINSSRFFLNPADFFQGIKRSNEERSVCYGFFREEKENLHPNTYSLIKSVSLLPKDYNPPAEWITMVKKMPLKFTFFRNEVQK